MLDDTPGSASERCSRRPFRAPWWTAQTATRTCA